MTDAEAWREIARWWAGPRVFGASSSGLCLSVVALHVPRSQELQLARQLNAARTDRDGQHVVIGYWWPMGGGRSARCILALFLAEAAEDEGR